MEREKKKFYGNAYMNEFLDLNVMSIAQGHFRTTQAFKPLLFQFDTHVAEPHV